MLEPVGLLGTLIGIIQVCGKLVSVCYDYRMGVRDAPQDISRILDEVSSIGTIAQQLVKAIESDDASSLPSLPSLQATDGDDGTLRRCLVELQDLKASLKLAKPSSLGRALAWPLQPVDAERILQTLATTKSTLQLALAADNTWVVCDRICNPGFSDGSSSQNMEVLSLTRSLPSVEKKATGLSESVAQSDEGKLRFRVNKTANNSLRL